MYTIKNSLNEKTFKGLNAEKLLNINAQEILQITLEKGALFPKHIAPRDAHLIVLEGDILFFINSKEYKLSKYQVFSFPKNEDHWVKAIENSKFLIIR